MEKPRPLFQSVLGLGTFKVTPDEIRYDPMIGKPGERHWFIARSELQDITIDKKLVGYTLTFQTNAGTYTAPNFRTDDDVLQVYALVLPQKLPTDPMLIAMQHRKAELAAKQEQEQWQQQQQVYAQQLEAYHKSLQTEQLVRSYTHDPEKEFQKDAAQLARDGWRVHSQTAGGMKQQYLASMLVVGFGGKRKIGEMTVVYTRQPRPLPMPTPPQRFSAATQASAPFVQSAPPSQPAIPPAQPAQASVAPPQDDLMSQLERLGALHQKGILTDEEFASKKADILSRI